MNQEAMIWKMMKNILTISLLLSKNTLQFVMHISVLSSLHLSKEQLTPQSRYIWKELQLV